MNVWAFILQQNENNGNLYNKAFSDLQVELAKSHWCVSNWTCNTQRLTRSRIARQFLVFPALIFTKNINFYNVNVV